MTLTALRTAADAILVSFEELVPRRFPGRDKWDWYRAIAAVKGENIRRNDDQSQDAALAADQDIKSAHDAYITALHRFYSARDGEGGVLGRMR